MAAARKPSGKNKQRIRKSKRKQQETMTKAKFREDYFNKTRHWLTEDELEELYKEFRY